MSRLGNLLAAHQAEYGAMIAGLSRNDLIDHLGEVLGKAMDAQLENPFRDEVVLMRMLANDPDLAMGSDFDPLTLHNAIAHCINLGFELPHACTLRLAKGVAEPESLRRKKGKTHQVLHHEIWRLCLVLKEYRQMQLGSGESKPTRSSNVDTAFGLIAKAAKGLRTTTNLSEGQVRDIYYEREMAYRKIPDDNFPP